jgi:CheY-like chemotaxis protein
MSPLTVLVVEDDPWIRGLLDSILHDHGYAVVDAPDGRQAIQVLDEASSVRDAPDVVLLDMMLPHLDGLAVLHHMLDHGHSTPVIALSASDSYLHAAAASGARATIRKPFDVDDLVDEVDRCCKRAD